jgi:hypothetical protein
MKLVTVSQKKALWVENPVKKEEGTAAKILFH